jgi:hypothetical protein
VPDTLVRGVVAESMVRNPATGNIWFSNSLAAGGFAPEGRFADSTTFRRWYALDPATDEIVDSLQWQDPAGSNPATVDEKPRGIAFSPDGNTAYAVVFDALSGEPSVQKFIRGATAIERDENVIPERFALEGNYPNPFNPSTSIRFSLDEPGLTRLAVYDVLGREVAVLVNEQLAAGSYTATFDASGLSSGTYLYRLDFQGQQQTGTMTFFK